jgi:hypothetical protein
MSMTWAIRACTLRWPVVSGKTSEFLMLRDLERMAGDRDVPIRITARLTETERLPSNSLLTPED